MFVVVTGCAGFIGSKVTDFLLRKGHTVIGVDSLNDAYDVRLKNWRLEQLDGKPEFEFFELDICNRDGLRDLFHSLFAVRRSPIDAIINLAARAGVRQSVENPWIYFDTNVSGTLNLLELCREFGVKKFILASTSSLYGEPNVTRQSSIVNRPNEPYRLNEPNKPNQLGKPFSEDDPTNGPLSPYAASKKAAEALCYTYHYLYGIDITVLRYFTVYGPAGRPDMSLFRFVQWISEGRPVTVYGDGQQSRDFTYVEDIAHGTVAALKPLGYEVINLGSDQPIVLNDAIRLIEELLGRKAKIQSKPRHPADVLATWADITKAERILDWRPQTNFKEGVAKLVEWYRSNRDWAKEIRTG